MSIKTSTQAIFIRKYITQFYKKKLRVGDSILPYINRVIKNKKLINTKLKMSSEYDFYFNENAILKCDLETIINNLTKNFLIQSFLN